MAPNMTPRNSKGRLKSEFMGFKVEVAPDAGADLYTYLYLLIVI